MRPGEIFETECYEFLTNNYQTQDIKFHHEGGMDSTKSDIAVIKKGNICFFIEAKDSSAQSGQFVLIPDNENKQFVFSPRNKSNPNELTTIIINYMNSYFERFNNAGTTGKYLNINEDVFANWIVEHYRSKNVRYVISRKNDFIIFPIRKFQQYFNIRANYRIKKSGSGEPPKRDILTIKQLIKNHYNEPCFTQSGNKLFVEIHETLTNDKFVLGNYTYFLAERNPNTYEIRKLSNTYNMNVIFEIDLKKSQASEDLDEFISEINS